MMGSACRNVRKIPIGLRTILAVAPVIFFVLAARADEAPSLFQSHFARVADGEPCYARSYVQEHLKAHPDQRVGAIEIDMAKLNPDGKPITEATIELGFGMQLAGKAEWYATTAVCKSDGARMDCFLEGDGGRFVLEDGGGGALKVSVGDYGIAIEGASDALEIAGDKGDDRVFMLSSAPREVCNAAKPSQDQPSN